MTDPAGPFVNAYVESGSVVLLSRDAGGRLVERRVTADYASFHRREDILEDKLRRLRDHPAVRAIAIDDRGWVRISWRDRDVRERAVSQKKGVINPIFGTNPIYEGDVHPVRRWMTDNRGAVQPPRRLYFDLETDSRVPFASAREGGARILAWTVVSETGAKVSKVLDEFTDRSERELLEAFWRVAADYDQLIAWNGDGFDFPVLQARTKILGLRVAFGRFLWLDHMALFRRMNLNAAESGDEKTSMKLQDVAMAVVGKGKTEFNGAFTWQAWSADPLAAPGTRCPGCGQVHDDRTPRECLRLYNEQDTELLPEIEKETGYIALFQALAEACCVFPDSRSLHPTYQVDGFMLGLARDRGTHFLTKEFREEVEQFRGAYVMEPQARGITRDVHVADFRRLYPSIIITWNMSPETKVVGAPDPRRSYCTCPTTGIRFYTDVEGMLPAALRTLIDLRDYWQKEKAKHPPGTDAWHAADRLSMAYKVAANSFYGVIGSPFSRYFDREIAESVTQTGVWLIHLTKAEVEARGWRVIYADTDSAMTVGCTTEDFREFARWCNEHLYPPKIAAFGCAKNDVWLEYEKAYARIVFVSAKRYAACYLHYKGKAATAESKPEVKGLEYKRGDTAYLARKLQKGVIDQLTLHACERVEDYERMIREAQRQVLEGQLPVEHVQITQTLTKELREYAQKRKKDGTDAAQSPHVRVAKVLLQRGAEVMVGTRIAYVVLDHEKREIVPAEDFRGDCDRHYLWEQKVYPPTQRFLEAAFPDHDWTAYARTRPKKPRGGGGAAGHRGAAVATVEEIAPLPARPRRDVAPYVIGADGVITDECARELREIVEQFPGPRPVVVQDVRGDVDFGRYNVCGEPDLSRLVVACLTRHARHPQPQEERGAVCAEGQHHEEALRGGRWERYPIREDGTDGYEDAAAGYYGSFYDG